MASAYTYGAMSPGILQAGQAIGDALAGIGDRKRERQRRAEDKTERETAEAKRDREREEMLALQMTPVVGSALGTAEQKDVPVGYDNPFLSASPMLQREIYTWALGQQAKTKKQSALDKALADKQSFEATLAAQAADRAARERRFDAEEEGRAADRAERERRNKAQEEQDRLEFIFGGRGGPSPRDPGLAWGTGYKNNLSRAMAEEGGSTKNQFTGQITPTQKALQKAAEMTDQQMSGGGGAPQDDSVRKLVATHGGDPMIALQVLEGAYAEGRVRPEQYETAKAELQAMLR